MSSAPIPLIAGRALPGPAGTRPLRETALAELSAVGWPTLRRERWRYTDLQALANGDFELSPSAPTREDVALARSLAASAPLATPAARLVFVDGHRIPELGATAIQGLEIANLEDSRTRPAPSGTNHILTRDHPLAALNTAFTQGGLALRIPPGTVLEPPLHLLFVSSARAALAPQARVIIEVGAGARLTVVQHFIGDDVSSGWINSVTEVHQSAGAKLDLYRIQRHGPHQAHTSLLAAHLDADSELRVGYFDLGGQLVRNDLDVKLTERGARTELFGVFLAGAGQHVDDHLLVDHIAPETRSDEAFRGIIGRRGRGVFNGKVVVQPNAQRIDARQSSDNLLLAEQAEIDTKPELEIYADDVKCSHGSTVGELDTDQLFYLRTRGIDEATARELLTTAFAAVVLERIHHDDLRAYVAEQVAISLRTLAEQAR